ncbi:hypothetical protein BDZ89DRAFT_765530 [Hymenopellis radicata]|nr:hypothetical protein BDZ89DRAFT_765530 [Hymenopellis radicata]
MILLARMDPTQRAYSGPRCPILPVINSISIVMHEHGNERYFQCLDSHEILADMLRIRWKPEEDPVFGVGLGRLRKFKLWVHATYLDDAEFDQRGVGYSKGHRLPEAIKQALQDLVDDGMDLSIRVTTKRIEKGQDYVRLAIG